MEITGFFPPPQGRVFYVGEDADVKLADDRVSRAKIKEVDPETGAATKVDAYDAAFGLDQDSGFEILP